MLEIDTSKTPAVALTIGRYAATLLGGWMVRHGYMSADDTQLFGGAVIGFVAVAFGVFSTIRNKERIKEAAITPPGAVKFK